MKLRRRFTALVLALVMVFSLTVNASAAAAQTVTVKLSPNITVSLNGEPQAMSDVNGNPVYPVLYGGTTYLPVRAVGNMLGLDVGWDQATQTVLLTSSGRDNTAAGNTAKSTGSPKDITVQINPNITVKLDGKAQEMKDTNGNPVYPMLYGGTTYLPVRAVSNMMGVMVDWNQATQTVVLGKTTDNIPACMDDGIYGQATFGNKVNIKVFSDKITIEHDGKTEAFGFNEIDIVRTTLDEIGPFRKDVVDNIIQIFVDVCSMPPIEDPFKNITTAYRGNGSKTITETGITSEWAEIDWSHANDGYVTVRINELPGPNTRVFASVKWANRLGVAENDPCIDNALAKGEWNIPLRGGKTEYVIDLTYRPIACSHILTDKENASNFIGAKMTAKFKADIDDPNIVWLMSTPHSDFKNAPLASTKALELTKNCKTDAEKVTAIFNWVVNNIKYDNSLSYSVDAYDTNVTCHYESDGKHLEPAPYQAADYYDLDKIFSSRSGICVHYAVLTVGMLRSVGIPCRAVSGEAYNGIKKGGHAWVEISPDIKGLDKTALGAGTGRDGWIRLDPTFVATGGTSDRSFTANDNNYFPTGCYY